MLNPASNDPEQVRLAQRALARWDNEGGHQTSAGQGSPQRSGDSVPPLTNAELVRLQIRVIALENLMLALLADASDAQLARVRDIAALLVIDKLRGRLGLAAEAP